MQNRRPRRATAGAVLGTLLLLAVVAGCIRLGIWQLDRLSERRALNARVAGRQAEPPLAGAGPLADTALSLYRTVELSGRWDHARSIVLPGRSLRGVPGVHLLTPLLVEPDLGVLVNRGWVPAADGATIPLDSFPAGAGTGPLLALVLPFPGTGRVPQAAADSGFRRVWYRPDREALSAQYPYALLPVELQLLPGRDAAGYPEPLPPPALDQGPHLSYAIQWFAFAAIGVIGWIALVLRSGRPRPLRPAPPAP